MATKIAIGVVGDCCGKSTYIQRVTTGHFQDKGIVTPFKLLTTAGEFEIIFKEGVVDDVQAVIIMFDGTSKSSFESGLATKDAIAQSGKPHVICANNWDCNRFIDLEGGPYPIIYLSVLLNYNIEKPIIDLLRSVTGVDKLIWLCKL
jgi:hypothetical protein